MSLNKVTLQGNLTRDPLVQGKTTRLTLAVDHTKREGTTYVKTGTSFINLVTFKGLAESVAKEFKKGDAIDIEGSLHTSSYEDAQKVTHYTTEVWVNKLNKTVFGKKAAQN